MISQEQAINATKAFITKTGITNEYSLQDNPECYYRKQIIRLALQELKNGKPYQENIPVPTKEEISTDVKAKIGAKLPQNANNLNKRDIEYFQDNVEGLWYRKNIIFCALLNS